MEYERRVRSGRNGFGRAGLGNLRLAERVGMRGEKLEREIDESFFVDVFERLARLRQIEPAGIVDLVVVARWVAREITHEKERDRFAVLRLSDVKPVRDLAQTRHDLAPAPGLLVDFAQGSLLGRLARLDV